MLFLKVQCFLIAYLVYQFKHQLQYLTKYFFHSVIAVMFSSDVSFNLSFKNFS